jgi:catechol 2,3-dioxygenase-like lactoylglutathione lyase family enzyme
VDNKASDIGSPHVCFKTDDIEELYQKLLTNKAKVHCPPQKMGGASLFYFRDPDGIILEAIEGETRV